MATVDFLYLNNVQIPQILSPLIFMTSILCILIWVRETFPGTHFHFVPCLTTRGKYTMCLATQVQALLSCMGPNSNPFHQGRKGKLRKWQLTRGEKKNWYLILTFKYRLGSNLFMQLFRENDHKWALIISIRSDVITVYTKSILCSVWLVLAQIFSDLLCDS